MNWPSIKELAARVTNGVVRPSELVEQALAAVEDKKEYQAIIALTADRARIRAKELDEKIATGASVGRLAGIPFIAKDNFLTFGSETTAASNILKGFEAPYQATAIEKLEAEGAICIAKANLDAFAHGSSTENSDFFTTSNPHDKARVPGGSSGGSAAAVILGMAPFALGTDTGGSIRLPAAFCGAVGLKPTYGLVSRSGVVAMASSTDVIGPITRTVEDAAIVLDVIAGRDELDSTTIDANPNGYVLSDNVNQNRKLRIGVVKEYMGEGLDDEIRKTIQNSVVILKQQGHEVSEISLPSLQLALAVYYIICPAEVSSNLSRYDGQHYGYSDPEATTLESSYELSRSNGFGKEAKRRIIIGTYVLSSGYYDAFYKKAQLVRTKLIREFEEAFARVDMLIGPTAPATAFKIGENIKDPMKMYLTDIMTVAANLVGIPAISIPAGEVKGLPVGLQIMAPYNKDDALLEFASTLEGAVNG